MSMDFFLEFNNKYIHIIHAPDYEVTPESLKKLWTELAEACEKYHCLKVFAEGFTPPKRQIKTMDALESGSRASRSIPGLMLAICFKDYIPDKITKYFTDVAYNRGALIQFFANKKEALEWLGVTDIERQ